jgi:PAS domain S-box-containing protein
MSPDWQEMRYLVGRDFITDTKEPSRTWLQQYIHPDDREQVTAVIRRAIRARRVFELEHRVRRVDGSLGWTFSRAIPIMDAEGKIIEWFGTAKDVTARKAAEEEREQTLAEFNTTLLCMTDGVMVFKPDGSLSLMNPAAERILGCSRKNHGCPLGDWFKQLDVTRENGTPFRPEHSLTARALRGETVEPTALSVRTPDGRQFWILSSAAALRTAAGECIGAVTVFADITERKKAEEALRASEERFRIIAASTPDHLLVQDRNLRYTLVVNPQLGLTKQEMIGKTDHDFLLKAEADKLRRLKQKVLRTGQKLHVEMPATSRTGELVYFEGDYVPKRNLQGAVDGLIGYIRNVTERKQAEQALEQANTELRRLARRLTQIEEAERRRLAYVLHEGLQQLLVSALFQLSDLANQRKGRAVRKEIAEVADILDECVNVTRTVTYDSYPPALQQLGIGAALEWLQRYCQKNLGLSVDLLVDEAVQVEVEELKICLFRAAQELLLNVAKHAGVKNARIRLGGHAGREVWLEVSDAGAGFDPAALRVNKSTGSSFGLFSLRERVAMLGGRLEVDSARGAGTRVRLWLPLLPHKSRAGSVAGQPVMNQVCREQKQT